MFAKPNLFIGGRDKLDARYGPSDPDIANGLRWVAERSTPRWLVWLLVLLVASCIAFAVGVWWHLLSALP